MVRIFAELSTSEFTAWARLHFMSLVCTMECRLNIAVSLYLISVLSFARAQVECPPFNVSELGTTDMLTQGGLIGAAFQAVSGDPSPLSVQVHDSNIVCFRSGRTRDTYSGVSVVVNYTCTGTLSECIGNPILSQFEFECGTGPRWTAIVGGSASNIITTPPNGSLSTILRTDCGVCVSPARLGFAAITNNDQHCGCKSRVVGNNELSVIKCLSCTITLWDMISVKIVGLIYIYIL